MQSSVTMPNIAPRWALLPTRLRTGIVGMTAIALSLPIAWISLTKLLVFGAALGVLVAGLWRGNRQADLRQLPSLRWVLMALALFALSLLWTSAESEVAWASLVKHGKLLVPFLLVMLVRSVREARLAIGLFVLGQAGLIVLSWIEASGLPMQWLFTRPWGVIPGVVFTSYLDQSIIFAASAAVLWHLRGEGFGPVWLMVALALSMLANVVFLLPGRTGYLVVILVLTLAAMWALPQRWRLAAFLVIPLLTLVALWFGSPKIQARLSLVYTESQAFSVTSNPGSSAGFRLHAWKRSLQAIGEEPGKGFGVGGWTATVRRLEGPTADAVFGTGKMSNPHQEYLLWGVELGLVGLLLLPALVVALVRDFGRFAPPIARAGQSLALAMALACLFNSSLYDGLIGDYFCVLLGLLLAYGLALQNGQIRDSTTL